MNFIVYLSHVGRRMSEHFMSWRRFFWCNTESDKNAFFFLFFSDIYMRNMERLCNDLHFFSQHHHRHNIHTIGLWAAYYYEISCCLPFVVCRRNIKEFYYLIGSIFLAFFVFDINRDLINANLKWCHADFF